MLTVHDSSVIGWDDTPLDDVNGVRDVGGAHALKLDDECFIMTEKHLKNH